MMGHCCFFPSARGIAPFWLQRRGVAPFWRQRGVIAPFSIQRREISPFCLRRCRYQRRAGGPRLQVGISKPHRSLTGSAANFSVLCSAMDNLTVLPSATSLAVQSQKHQWTHKDFLKTHRFLSAPLITRFCLQRRRGERRTREDNGCTLISWRHVATSPGVHW